MVSLCRTMRTAWSIAQRSCKRTRPIVWVCYFVERRGDSKANNDKENCGLFRRFTGFVFGRNERPGQKKAPGINAEGLSAARKALLDAVDGLTDEQCEKLLGIVLEAKRVL